MDALRGDGVHLGNRHDLHGLGKLQADLELSAFEIKLVDLVFFEEFNQFLLLTQFFRRHESLVCFRVVSNQWMPGSTPGHPPG